MKTNMKPDDRLSDLLRREWTAAPGSHPDFRAGVWARIDAEARAVLSWRGWLRRHAPAVSGLALASLSLSITSSFWLASHLSRQEREHQILTYVTSLHPQRPAREAYTP